MNGLGIALTAAGLLMLFFVWCCCQVSGRADECHYEEDPYLDADWTPDAEICNFDEE